MIKRKRCSYPRNLSELQMLEALASMRNQYCSSHGHMFMSAGEGCSALLEEYGYLPHDDYRDLSAKGGEAKTPRWLQEFI